VPDDLDDVIDRLLSVDLDARDVADVLWLAATTRVGSARSPDLPDPDQLSKSLLAKGVAGW
jgi:hypothetical protein